MTARPKARFTTPSGIEVPEVVTRDMAPAGELERPAQYPFTRGIFEDGFRGRPWTIRQYSGFGSAEESNQRYRFLLEQGQTGLSVALDLPTQCGYDPDDPRARPEIGKVGVSLFSLSEMETLFENIDLGAISTSFTINGNYTQTGATSVLHVTDTGPLTVTGTMGYDWAVVCDGGVPMTEIDTRTMASRLHPNLFVVGDLLHVSRPSGGYSLQLCWTTGFIAGENA